MPDDRQVNRRNFFREGLRELLKPISSKIESAAEQLAQMDSFSSPAQPQPGKWLRPPGALPERQFLDRCSHCAACVRVCPAQAIKLDPNRQKGGGAPYIEPDAMACTVCTGLYCMPACPTDALRITPLNQIKMGTAIWNEESCLRSHGEDCQICVDHCPLGSFAIEVTEGKINVHEKGCIGCGVCQHDCPTLPKSIVVEPNR
jgi:MauM/NapG family ferredoxin protein